jgi:hypothetical protein
MAAFDLVEVGLLVEHLKQIGLPVVVLGLV